MKDPNPIIMGPTWITPLEMHEGRLCRGEKRVLLVDDELRDRLDRETLLDLAKLPGIIGRMPDTVLIDARTERMHRRVLHKAWKA
jgi:hypothetical protein